MRFLYKAIILFFTVNICMADDTPTGKSLLKACEIAQKNGYNSTEGMLCVWYATPCDCHTDESIPAVCLPADYQVEHLAEIVIKELKQQPDLQTVSAIEAAAHILAPLYPCPY